MEPADTATLGILLDGAIAIGIGLFIGLEREQHETTSEPKPHEALMGVRTFALLSLFGWLAGLWAKSNPWIPVAALIVIGVLVGLAALTPDAAGKGLTTEVAALATFLLGMLVHEHRLLAVGFALAVLLLLISKPWFRTLVPKMRREDLTSALQLAVLLAIVLPLLPTEAQDPWKVLSPRKLGMFVALIAAINFVGYVLNRFLGSQRSAGVIGIVGGLASSTAVTAAMAQQAKESEAMVVPGQLATMLASTMMFLRMAVVCVLIAPKVALAVAVPIGAMSVVTIAGAFWKWRAMRASKPPPGKAVEMTNPFSLIPALKLGALLAVILVVSELARQWLGHAGLLATAAISGLVDVDPIILAATKQAVANEVPLSIAALAVMIAIGSNTLVKAGIAFFAAGRVYALPLLAVFGTATAAGLLAAVVMRGVAGAQ
jgi:uncharacterized membrane protein (DUF4010 family)